SASRGQASDASRPEITSSASDASAPEVSSTTSEPPVAPSASTWRMLLASARRSPAISVTDASYAAAARTSLPAGRAWRSTPSGSRTVRTWPLELTDIPGLLGRRAHRVQVAPGGGRHRGGDGALDQRRVGQYGVDAVGHAVRQHGADAEDGAADIGQHHHPGAGVGLDQRAGNSAAVGAQGALGPAAGGHDRDAVSRNLAGHRGQALGDRGRVRDQYNARRAGVIHADDSTMSN